MPACVCSSRFGLSLRWAAAALRYIPSPGKRAHSLNGQTDMPWRSLLIPPLLSLAHLSPACTVQTQFSANSIETGVISGGCRVGQLEVGGWEQGLSSSLLWRKSSAKRWRVVRQVKCWLAEKIPGEKVLGWKRERGRDLGTPLCACYLLAKMDSSARVSERFADILWASAPSPEDPFWACTVWEVSLTPRMRNMWPPYRWPKQGLTPLCSATPFILKCPQETQSSCLSYSFVIIFVSKHKQEASSRCLTWGLSISFLKRPKSPTQTQGCPMLTGPQFSLCLFAGTVDMVFLERAQSPSVLPERRGESTDTQGGSLGGSGGAAASEELGKSDSSSFEIVCLKVWNCVFVHQIFYGCISRHYMRHTV